MSEEIKDTEQVQKPEATAEPEKKYSDEDVNQIIDKKFAKWKTDQEEAIAEAVEKAKAEATLTGKELQEYKEKEAERKLAEKDAEIERLKQVNAKRELKDEAIKTLSEKGMPVTDKILNFVVRDTADATLQAIDDMGEILKEQKEASAQTKPPKSSGGLGNAPKQNSLSNILDEAKITNF